MQTAGCLVFQGESGPTVASHLSDLFRISYHTGRIRLIHLASSIVINADEYIIGGLFGPH
jgi:hypothetical protein